MVTDCRPALALYLRTQGCQRRLGEQLIGRRLASSRGPLNMQVSGLAELALKSRPRCCVPAIDDLHHFRT